MEIFLTGVTGFLGGEILILLSKKKEIKKIYCLIRAKNEEEGYLRLEHVFELHGDHFDKNKVFPIIGNLSDTTLSNELINNNRLQNINLIIHAAANTSFGRMYDDLVQTVNIGGLNHILQWVSHLKKLETFVYVGTATICGKQVTNRVVFEDESPNINAAHLVKYSYTKMMGEINVRKVIPEDKLLIVRPSIIMGDSRPIIPRSNVILWALATLNLIRLIPVNPYSDLDIIPVDFASESIVKLIFGKRNHNTYHISSGTESKTNTLLVTNQIANYFPEKPPFKFLNHEFISQMKDWARNRIKPGNTLSDYNEYLDYWKQTFEEKSNLRILFAGLEPYLNFIELGQIFDNSRLINDTGIAYPEPAHEYVKRSISYLKNIDVFEGAIDP
ncbi:MAG: SDR family oxidoreductase [Bacteroidota bacterium]|nr:SDR family oxidoreductase [Bacteroidota bacterium]